MARGSEIVGLAPPDSHFNGRSGRESNDLGFIDRGSFVASFCRCWRQVFWSVPLLGLVTSGCGDWPPVVESTRDIERLSVSELSIRARGLQDVDIPALERFKNLEQLDFGGGRAAKPARLTDSGLAALAKLDLPSLETLNLGWNENITDAGLAHVARMPKITFLSLMYCLGITDAGLAELVHAGSLTELDMQGNPNITDNGIQQLADKSNWERIILYDCPLLTPNGVSHLREILPHVKIFSGL